jgi:putative transposase
MLTDDARIAALKTAGLTPEGIQLYLDTVNAPSRNTDSRGINVRGKFPSPKMGRMIAFESRTIEFPLVLELEYDERVQEFFDQVAPIKVIYSRNGKKYGSTLRSDFLVLANGEIVALEGATEGEMTQLAQKDPERYKRTDKPGYWIDTAAQESLGRLGIRHVVRTDRSLNYTFVRNAEFLLPYLRQKLPLVAMSRTLLSALDDALRTQASITLEEFFERSPETKRDDVFSGIVHGYIPADLCAEPLVNLDKFKIYRSHAALDAARAIEGSLVSASDVPQPLKLLQLDPGVELYWDGVPWKVLNSGASSITLSDPQHSVQRLERGVVTQLVASGAITGIGAQASESRLPQALQLHNCASDTEIDVAKARYRLIKPWLDSTEVQPKPSRPKTRSERRFLRAWRSAEERYGSGYVGLLPQFKARGDRRSRLLPAVQEVCERLIGEQYVNARNLIKSRVYEAIKLELQSRGLTAPSFQTVSRLIDRARSYETEKVRVGRRGAYHLRPGVEPEQRVLPTHGEYAFQRAEIDHTQIDLEMVDSETSKNLGRPWISVMLDTSAELPLAFVLSYAAPSERTLMALLRDCVRRWGRLPETISSDNGSEFGGENYETRLALLNVKYERRPPSHPRGSSSIERFNLTLTTQAIHPMLGNTKLMKNPRAVSDEVNPKNLAVWTLPSYYKHAQEYFFDVYPNMEHAGLRTTPAIAFNRTRGLFGERTVCTIPYDREFMVATMVSRKRTGTAKVTATGMRVENMRYDSAYLRPHVGKRVRVRIDSDDVSKIVAFIDGQWRDCFSTYREVFQGRSSMEIKLASEAIRATSNLSRRAGISDTRLAKFLMSAQHNEALLLQMHKDREEELARSQDADLLVDPPAHEVPEDTGEIAELAPSQPPTDLPGFGAPGAVLSGADAPLQASDRGGLKRVEFEILDEEVAAY